MPTMPLHFPADHPAFEGHFPQRPIVPGVLLVAWAQAAMETHLGLQFDAMTEAKFHSTVSPTDALEVEFEGGEVAVRFEIRSTSRKVASGRFPLPACTAP
jgi:3-hydroxyacyl-[acyl-carrier-protein] dehydratase